MTTREEEKDAAEVAVFLDFVAVAQLAIRRESVEHRRPREPDILCRLEGEGAIAFELVALADEGLAEEVSLAVRRGVAPEAAWVDQTIDKLRAKVEDKTYDSPHPMELVAWADPFFLPRDAWLGRFEPDLRALHGRSLFRRIWVVNLGGPDAERGVWFVNPPR